VSRIQILSPVDGSIYAERSTASAEAVGRATAAARNAAGEWRATALAERASRCNAAVDAMLAMASEIVPELAWQMGRPVRYGPGELKGFEERARHMIEIAPAALEPIDPGPKPGFTRRIRREPLGVVFTIAPWNYPYLTTVNSVIPALMAGNAVLLKHASNTLLVGERFQRAFDDAGLPPGLFQHLVLDHDQMASIIASGAVDTVCFTGSVPAGRSMERAAAGHFIATGLELGGKDPAYVRADANLEHAIENIADGAFFNSGQSCCGIERIYVDAHLYDDFVDGVVEVARGYVLGNPLDPATTLGPLVKTSAAEFVRGQVGDAVAAGARTHVDAAGFDRDAAGSPYMAPQVLTDVNHDMRIMTEETFGPVVGIMKVGSDDEAVRLMNDSDFGLTAAVWTEDEDAAIAIGERLETGTVFMNRCDYLDPALAWTGVKDTGRGCTLSTLGYGALTRPKSFHLRTSTA
jgi:acyl-CoA reductase-like NAD-dependent aldehyde dehydrogenase